MNPEKNYDENQHLVWVGSPGQYTKTSALLHLKLSCGLVIIVIQNIPHDLARLDTCYINLPTFT